MTSCKNSSATFSSEISLFKARDQFRSVLYHELSHALHHRTGKLRASRSKADQRDNEIVAEMAAATLVRLFEGKEMSNQAISYVKTYGAKKKHLAKLLPEIIEVVDLAVCLGANGNYDRGKEGSIRELVS